VWVAVVAGVAAGGETVVLGMVGEAVEQSGVLLERNLA